MASIAEGDTIPDGTLAFDNDGNVKTISIYFLSAAKKVVLFTVPGASPLHAMVIFLKHVPGFLERAQEFKTKGVDELMCISGIR
ncbi:Peroxiredoxin-2B, partial [Mucuna pruriens]